MRRRPVQITAKDSRSYRDVVKYADDIGIVEQHAATLGGVRQAFDVLSCGHTVPCQRAPGGRLVNHQEPCGFCVEGTL